jgi:hypothetical protein
MMTMVPTTIHTAIAEVFSSIEARHWTSCSGWPFEKLGLPWSWLNHFVMLGGFLKF